MALLVSLILFSTPQFFAIQAFAEVTSSESSDTPRARRSNRKRKQRTTKKSSPRQGRSSGSSQGAKGFQAQLYQDIRAFGCNPQRLDFYGSRGRRSCHPQSKAGDLHSMNCSGTTHTAIKSSRTGSKFGELAAYLRKKGYFVMWHQCTKGGSGPTECHRDHIHASKCCTVNGRKAC